MTMTRSKHMVAMLALMGGMAASVPCPLAAGEPDDDAETRAVIDKAIANIDAQRADLGAIQNRFDSTISNLTSIMENTTASRGRIEDVVFAAETANLTKQQTLQQASTAILAQANQLPAAVLKLLG